MMGCPDEKLSLISYKDHNSQVQFELTVEFTRKETLFRLRC